jgi:NAD(P)-dependent dehydrogenase (short-subunit alcohol dehydrogenase family)
MRFNGRTVIITGGSLGAGLAASRLFAREGANVVIASRGEKAGNEAVAMIQAEGGEAVYVPCDVSRATDCENAVNVAVEKYGGVDILVNNAGIVVLNTTVVNTSEEDWDKTMEINLSGAFYMSRYTVPHMIKAGKGAIVNVSSILGVIGGFGGAPYCASKGGMVMLTRAMALDHAQQNIRVNCILPGTIDSPMLKGEMEVLGGDEEKLRQMFASKHPMNRISTPEEQAHAILFLASDEASFITGAILPVDGGRTTW